MPPRDFSSAKDLLPSLLARLARQGGPARSLQAVWAEAVGAQLSRHAQVVGLTNDVLTLRVSTPAWAQVLARQERELCARLNQQVGPPGVQSLRFQVG